MGTTDAYFERYRYASSEQLRFADGRAFDDLYDAVLGAEVAARLGYVLNDAIVVTHGGGSIGITKHDDKPFRVAGILERTGTPVDRTVHVSLEGIEAMHVDWASGVRLPGRAVTADQARSMDLTPKAITAALIGLKSRIAVFRVQRFVNEYRQEPLLAILAGARVAGTLGSHGCRGECASRCFGDGRGFRIARHAHGDSDEPGGAASGDGGAALGGCTTDSSVWPVHE